MGLKPKLIIFLLVTLVVVASGLIGLVAKRRATSTGTSSSHSSGGQDTSAVTTGGDTPALLKSIGFNLDYYNPATNKAGDMVFTHEDHNLSGHSHLIWADFGTQDPRSPGDPTKTNVHPVFVLPLGTKVHALIDGNVTDIKTLYSGDSTIWVTANQNSLRLTA